MPCSCGDVPVMNVACTLQVTAGVTVSSLAVPPSRASAESRGVRGPRCRGVNPTTIMASTGFKVLSSNTKTTCGYIATCQSGNQSGTLSSEIGAVAFRRREPSEMNAIAVGDPSTQTLLKLARVSKRPTVWTNVIAGAAITNAGATIADVAVIGLAMTAFYVGGMYLNDF